MTRDDGPLDHPIVHLVRDRYREFVREPGVLFWTFGFPILLVIVLSIAFRGSEPEPMTVAVVAGAGAEELASRLEAAESLRAITLDAEPARKALMRGEAALLVHPGVPPRFVTDPSRPEANLVLAAARDALAPEHRPEIVVERVTVRGERYVDFLVPGLIGMTLLNGGAWGVGFGLILMRTRKLLKRLCATPMKRAHLLSAYLIFRLLISFVEAGILLAVGIFVFDTPCEGSLVALAILVALSALSFGGLGLLCATRAENPQSGNGYVNLATLPMFLVSGVFFSAKNFPAWLQPMIDALPLTAFNDALRAILNEGASLASLGFEFAVLLAWGAVCFLVALRIFKWS
jgi:ABC-2 type transport system permease protein